MKIKHYEHLWEEAEMIASSYFEEYNDDDFLEKMKSLLSEMVVSNDDLDLLTQQMGDFIFMTSYLSHKYGVNTYTALQDAIDNARIEMLDPDLENDDV